MSLWRKHRDELPKEPAATSSTPREGNSRKTIRVTEISGQDKPLRRTFPGPRGAEALLRVAIDRNAHADLVAHAKESLNAEICGVLAGQVCEDDEGVFVHVQAIVRGTAASQGGTHVTFTQATWNAIYRALERDHPKLRIVGWYHSHPGFGVAFSEMDMFIQRNFFSGPTQIALVTDPLSGQTALCVNTSSRIEYLPRFWVDGREQAAQVPAQPIRGNTTGENPAMLSDDAAKRLQELESRVSAVVLALDEQRTSLYRFLLFVGLLFCVAIVLVAGYGIFLQLKARVEPPKNIGFAPVPVQIGEHTALLGVQVVSWQLPPELDAVQQAIDQFKRELEEQLAKGGLTNPSLRPLAPPASTDASSSPLTTNPFPRPLEPTGRPGK